MKSDKIYIYYMRQNHTGRSVQNKMPKDRL